MWSKVFFLSWETLFIQDVHGLFKVKLTFIEKIISDLNVCLRTLLKWGFNVLTMHLGMTFTSILQGCAVIWTRGRHIRNE